MARFFLELAYMGKDFAGFQVQKNADTIQGEVEKAIQTYFREKIELTGSSRTDAGVHAKQNYFHFDFDTTDENHFDKSVYHLNAILPASITIKRIFKVNDTSHCRFDAVSRAYHYTIYDSKDPFMNDRGLYFPYPLDMALLQEAAKIIHRNEDFESFCKKNAQVHTYECTIMQSQWKKEGNVITYEVKANRFLRGMVRGLVGTMLRVGSKKITLEEFSDIIASKDCKRVDFSTPAHGLSLIEVAF